VLVPAKGCAIVMMRPAAESVGGGGAEFGGGEEFANGAAFLDVANIRLAVAVAGWDAFHGKMTAAGRLVLREVEALGNAPLAAVA
jgi:hypothetical protein